ncbi:MAG: hypothetical protein JST26_17640 [Bacteroidetes bacterium]|nr:hypothetical protein [Bacteroidota bacterium]
MDTAYERYIEIALNDTLIDSLHVKLTLFSSGSQVIVKDTAYKANSVLRSANVADLGAYKINSLIWRIPLGDISLLTRHGIHLDIVGLKPGDSFTFDDEF